MNRALWRTNPSTEAPSRWSESRGARETGLDAFVEPMHKSNLRPKPERDFGQPSQQQRIGGHFYAHGGAGRGGDIGTHGNCGLKAAFL